MKKNFRLIIQIFINIERIIKRIFLDEDILKNQLSFGLNYGIKEIYQDLLRRN